MGGHRFVDPINPMLPIISMSLSLNLKPRLIKDRKSYPKADKKASGEHPLAEKGVFFKEPLCHQANDRTAARAAA